MKIEKLALARTPYQPVARGGKVGRVWQTIARHKRRAVAERLAQYARVDDADALVRIR
jgi:hypothetical protein